MYAPTQYLKCKDFIKQRAIAMAHISKSLSDKLPDYLALDLQKQYSIILAIEESINEEVKNKCAEDAINYDWNESSAVCQIYSAQLYRILDFIQRHPCEYLINDLASCARLAATPSRELANSEYCEIEAKIKLQQSQIVEVKYSTQYTCPKCRKRQCSIQEVQLRSFDEGANISAKCVNCDYKWIAA